MVFKQIEANDMFRISVCNSKDLVDLGLGLGQAEGSTTCYTCPPYSTASVGKQCQYCPGGRVGPSDHNGAAVECHVAERAEPGGRD